MMEDVQIALARSNMTTITELHDRHRASYSIIAALADIHTNSLSQLRSGRVPSALYSRDLAHRLSVARTIIEGCETFLQENRTRARPPVISWENLASYLHYQTAGEIAAMPRGAGNAELGGQTHAAASKIDGVPPSAEPLVERADRLRKLVAEKTTRKTISSKRPITT